MGEGQEKEEKQSNVEQDQVLTLMHRRPSKINTKAENPLVCLSLSKVCYGVPLYKQYSCLFQNYLLPSWKTFSLLQFAEKFRIGNWYSLQWDFSGFCAWSTMPGTCGECEESYIVSAFKMSHTKSETTNVAKWTADTWIHKHFDGKKKGNRIWSVWGHFRLEN